MPRILHTAHYSGRALEILRAATPAGFDVETLPEASRASLLDKARDADYLLVSGRLAIDEVVLASAPRLRMIQRTGVGIDMLDLDVIERHGIPVYVNSGVNARSVAEHALLLMLSCLRNLPRICGEVKRGIWKKQETGLSCMEIQGKTVGLVGLGAIGGIVAELVRAFGAHVIYFDPGVASAGMERMDGIERVGSFGELLSRSDIVSFHCPLTAETDGMLSAAAIAGMKDGACVVNTARGRLVDESALAEALGSGKLRAAALDVRVEEPPAKDDPLAMLDNVILTPHVAGLSCEAFVRMMEGAMANIAAFERGDLETIRKCRLAAKGKAK